MIDACELNRLLIDRGQELCAWLFPNGKVKGHEFFVGGLDGTAGESLHITLSGAAAGRFKDFADPDHTKGATFLWLIAKAKQTTFPEAIKIAKEFLGVKDEDFGIKRHHEKTFAKPERGGVRIAESNTPAMDYLVVERRLDPIVVANAKVCETDEGDAVVFPFLEKSPEGKEVCVHRKYLKLERPNGKKECWATKGTKKCLYGKHLIDDNISELTITEGEIDSLSMHSMGVPAVSIPNGVSDMEWIDLDWEWLQRFERINVCMDMDDPGQAAAPELCKRLGLHRCYIVSLPRKDVNECLCEGVTRDQMLCFLSNAKPIELDEIKRPREYTKEVIDFYTSDWSKRGWETPWYPALPWRVRKGEFTILSGFSGSGKALSLDTKIPTPTGWTTMGALFPGDKVFDENGKVCNVVFATPVQLNRDCYRVEFSDGSSIIADREHLWETWSPTARNSWSRQQRGDKRPRKTNRHNPQKHKMVKPDVVTTEQIKNSITFSRWGDGGHLAHAIPTTKPLDLPAADLPIAPYLLGAWLGDGFSREGMITNHKQDIEIIERIAGLGYSCYQRKLTFNQTLNYVSAPNYRIVGLTSKLRSLGLIQNKRIPSQYLRASIEQRIELLRGLLDTDGHASNNGGVEFSTSLPDLAADIKDLLVGLGIRVTVNEREAFLYDKKCANRHRMTFVAHFNPFNLKRKAEKYATFKRSCVREYRYITGVVPVESVPVKCIQVDSPSHLYLAGENMVPTHNTIGLNQLALHLIQQGVKVMDASLEVKPALTLYNMTRCALGKRNSAPAEVNGCCEWISESMFFLDCIGTVSVKRLMHAMEYARKRHGIDVFIIDSLFKCGLDPADFGVQRDFADKLTTFCNNTGAHVILVAHSRKTMNGNEYATPTKADVAGSSDITNAAFNVVIWWRNKLKKHKLDEARAAMPPDNETIAKWIDQPDAKVLLDKQRFGEGEEAAVHMWFNGDSYQFHTIRNTVRPYFRAG